MAKKGKKDKTQLERLEYELKKAKELCDVIRVELRDDNGAIGLDGRDGSELDAAERRVAALEKRIAYL